MKNNNFNIKIHKKRPILFYILNIDRYLKMKDDSDFTIEYKSEKNKKVYSFRKLQD